MGKVVGLRLTTYEHSVPAVRQSPPLSRAAPSGHDPGPPGPSRKNAAAIREGDRGCLRVARESGAPSRDEVVVCPLGPVRRRASGWEPPWNGRFRFFPLPDVIDGESYVRIFGRAHLVRPAYLTTRVAVLDEEAVVALRRRLVYAVTRVDPPLEGIRAKAAQDAIEMPCGRSGQKPSGRRTDSSPGSQSASEPTREHKAPRAVMDEDVIREAMREEISGRTGGA